MTINVTDDGNLVLSLPPRLRRQAGIKTGDQLQVKISPSTITLRAVAPRTYKPNKSEMAAIRRGEAAIARGQSVPLSEFLHDMDRQRRQARPKRRRKVSR